MLQRKKKKHVIIEESVTPLKESSNFIWQFDWKLITLEEIGKVKISLR